MVSVEMLKVPVFFNGDTVCYAASTSTVGASARQEFYLIHGSPRIPQWASNHVTLASWGPGWPVTPRQTKRGPQMHPKNRGGTVPVTKSGKPTEIGKINHVSYFLGEYYHHIGFFPWPC